MRRRFSCVVGFCVLVIVGLSCAGVGRANDLDKRATHDSRLRIRFEANRGQANPVARYISHDRNSTLFLTSTGATIVVTRVPGLHTQQPIPGVPGLKPDSELTKQLKSSALRIVFEGASRTVTLKAEDRLTGTTNYFIGADPRNWRTRIPTYRKVRYRSLYPGIDLAFYGSEGALEYDLIVSPGADPGRIRLRFEGARALDLNADGDIVASVSSERIVLHKPIIYQLAGSSRRSIAGGFKRLPDDEVGVQIANYDRSRPLIIDPTVTICDVLERNRLRSG